MKKKKKNYLDYVPVCHPFVTWSLDKNGYVTIRVENKGFYHKLAQLFFHRPRYSLITLDQLGSFAWQQMDGKRTVYEIANAVKYEFENDADPLYERIVRYFQILYQNKFVGYSY